MRHAAQRHGLVIGLVGSCTQRHHVDVVLHVLRQEAAVIVLHLVVVPGHQRGRRGAQGLQVLVEVVGGVAVAVGGQVADIVLALLAADDGLVGLVAVFVDVIAKIHDEVGVFGGHMAIGAEIAELIVRARGKGDFQLTGPGGGQRQGAGAAGAALGALGLEAVPVEAVGLQAGDLDVQGMGRQRAGRRLARQDRLLQRFVAIDRPFDGPRRGHATLPVESQWIGREPSPQHETVTCRIAAGDTHGKWRLRLRKSRTGEGGRGQAAKQNAAASENCACHKEPPVQSSTVSGHNAGC